MGVPQMLTLASALRRVEGAEVTLYDLDAERMLTGFSPERFGQQGYDIVALSCYSSYDYLKVMALGALLRPYTKGAWFVVGGYHASARPNDFTGDGSAFDYVVVGEGEQALVDLVQSRAAGDAPSQRILLGSSTEPMSTVPYPFELLERYRPAFGQTVNRFEMSLSRGCPYGCSFCMERTKRSVTWRPLSVDAAIEQIERAERFIDLRGKSLRITDALFGASTAWRRAFLERLAERPVAAEKIWLLTRADLLEREDFRLMARANVAVGFGLESGDPELLRRTGKVRDNVEVFHEKLFSVAEWAREHRVPFGANVIVGLPGETEASLERTARYLDGLFFSGAPSYGFFGIDRYRLYPGSRIAENLASLHEETGFISHRPRWWHDGDQDFLSEWSDPSAELGFEASMAKSFELFPGRLTRVMQTFAYTGPARSRFLATIRENLAAWTPRARARQQHLLGVWKPLVAVQDPTVEVPAALGG